MILVERPQELEDNISMFDGVKVLGCDTETTGLDPHVNKIRLLQLGNGRETLVVDVFKTGVEATAKYLKPILTSTEIVKVFHNAKFDLKFIKNQLKVDVERIYDSFLASTLLEGGIQKEKGYHGLDKVSERYTGIKVVKDQQRSDWSGILSKEQIEYAANDVDVLFPIREAQIIKLKEEKLTKVAKLEFDAVLPVAWLELCGFYLDMEEWGGVAGKHLEEANEYAELIYDELQGILEQPDLFGKATINLNSPQQITKYFNMLGIPMPENTRADTLLPMVKDYPIIGHFLEYKKHTKSSGTFGEGYRKFIHPVTGRIHADFFQLRAETGRFGVSRPNLNQIPRDNAHRGCFKAAPGNVIISNDFSQEELRILADFSGDRKFKALFLSGHDFHEATAATMLNLDINNISPDERDLAKRCNFGIAYCAGPQRLSDMAGIPFDEAADVIKTYFKTFTRVDKWMKYQKIISIRDRQVRSASGRIIKLEFDKNNWSEVARSQRNGVNSPIQGTGADILKRSLRVFYDNSLHLQDQIKLVNIVHDEINVESPENISLEVAELLKTSMITAGEEFIKSVPVKVDTKIGRVWNK